LLAQFTAILKRSGYLNLKGPDIYFSTFPGSFVDRYVKVLARCQGKKNRQEGGEMGEVPAGEGEENRVFPFLLHGNTLYQFDPPGKFLNRKILIFFHQAPGQPIYTSH
jgi:hypothetical protein